MSDYSRNASNESPASLNLELPLPTPPPQVSISVDPDLEYHVSTPSPSPSLTLAESVLPSQKDTSPPSPPSPSSKPSAPGGAPITSERSPKSPPAPSSSIPRPMRPLSDNCRGMSPFCGLEPPQPPSPLEPLPGPTASPPEQRPTPSLLHPPSGAQSGGPLHPKMSSRPHHGRRNHGGNQGRGLRLPP